MCWRVPSAKETHTTTVANYHPTSFYKLKNPSPSISVSPAYYWKKQNKTQIRAIENEISNQAEELEGESTDDETDDEDDSPKTKSREGNETPRGNDQQTHHRSADKAADNKEQQERKQNQTNINICKFFLNGKCRYGKKGKAVDLNIQ